MSPGYKSHKTTIGASKTRPSAETNVVMPPTSFACWGSLFRSVFVSPWRLDVPGKRPSDCPCRPRGLTLCVVFIKRTDQRVTVNSWDRAQLEARGAPRNLRLSASLVAGRGPLAARPSEREAGGLGHREPGAATMRGRRPLREGDRYRPRVRGKDRRRPARRARWVTADEPDQPVV